MYCSNCGRELKDGETCNCAQTAKDAAKGYDLNKFFMAILSVFTLLIELIKAPCTAVQSFMNRDNGKMGLKLMLVKAGFSTLYILLTLVFFHSITLINRVELAVLAFIASFALDFIFALIINLFAGTIAKKEISISSTMEISGLKAAGELTGLICAAVCSIFFAPVSFVFLIMGGLYGIMLSYTAMLQLSFIHKDKRVYLYIVSIFVLWAISALVYAVLGGGIFAVLIRSFDF